MESEILRYISDHGDTGVIIAMLLAGINYLRRRLNKCDEDHKECKDEIRTLRDRLEELLGSGLVSKRDSKGRFTS